MTEFTSTRPIIIAHRGNSAVAPQNTLAAFEAAWRAGAQSIELDIQLTGDGQVVIIHDDDVDATTNGHGALSGLTLAEVRALDAGAWFSPAYAGQQVPTLDEFIAFLQDRTEIELLLEIKGVWTPEQVALATGPLIDAGLSDRVIAQSFELETVEAIGIAAPELRRGLLIAEVTDDLLDRCADLGVMTCNPHGLLLVQHPDLVERLHAVGLEVMVWTLNEPAHWAAAVALNVDAIITDRPDRLAGWLTRD